MLKADNAETVYSYSKCYDRFEERGINSQDFVNTANELIKLKRYSEAIDFYNKAIQANLFALSGKGLALSILEE